MNRIRSQHILHGLRHLDEARCCLQHLQIKGLLFYSDFVQWAMSRTATCCAARFPGIVNATLRNDKQKTTSRVP